MLGQDMVKEPFHECHNRQRGYFPSKPFPGVFKPELNDVVFYRNDPVVADGSTMRVSANIFDNFFRSCKRRFGIDYPFAYDVDPTYSNNEMQVRMYPELTTPSMKNAIKSNLCSQAFGVVPEIQKSLGGAFEQKVIHESSIVHAQGIKHIGQGENTMVIGYWQ